MPPSASQGSCEGGECARLSPRSWTHNFRVFARVKPSQLNALWLLAQSLEIRVLNPGLLKPSCTLMAAHIPIRGKNKRLGIELSLSAFIRVIRGKYFRNIFARGWRG